MWLLLIEGIEDDEEARADLEEQVEEGIKTGDAQTIVRILVTGGSAQVFYCVSKPVLLFPFGLVLTASVIRLTSILAATVTPISGCLCSIYMFEVLNRKDVFRKRTLESLGQCSGVLRCTPVFS